MRRFLGAWVLLWPAYGLAAALSSRLVLDFVDLTHEAFTAWVLVPVAQALVLAAGSRRGPLLPAGRPPLLALVPLALALPVVAEGLRRPLDVHLGVLVPGSLQALLPRLLALVAAGALGAAAARSWRARRGCAFLAALLLALGLDAVRPWLALVPARLLPRAGSFVGGLLGYGVLLVLLFASALAAQRRLEPSSPWAARLLGAALALTFGAVVAALPQLFLHPWLERPWALLVPAGVSAAAALAAAAGLAAALAPGERA